MAYMIEIPTFLDERGSLSVAEKILPFEIKRFYYIYNISKTRGGHSHKTNVQALICLNGKCRIHIQNKKIEEDIIMNVPNKCLILEPEDWHTINDATTDSILLVLCSEYYDKNDYITEK